MNGGPSKAGQANQSAREPDPAQRAGRPTSGRPSALLCPVYGDDEHGHPHEGDCGDGLPFRQTLGKPSSPTWPGHESNKSPQRPRQQACVDERDDFADPWGSSTCETTPPFFVRSLASVKDGTLHMLCRRALSRLCGVIFGVAKHASDSLFKLRLHPKIVQNPAPRAPKRLQNQVWRPPGRQD